MPNSLAPSRPEFQRRAYCKANAGPDPAHPGDETRFISTISIVDGSLPPVWKFDRIEIRIENSDVEDEPDGVENVLTLIPLMRNPKNV
jgi:hypothetical protein